MEGENRLLGRSKSETKWTALQAHLRLRFPAQACLGERRGEASHPGTKSSADDRALQSVGMLGRHGEGLRDVPSPGLDFVNDRGAYKGG
jgi:hypothetical protein